MLSIEEIRAIGQICDTTWGRYSTATSPTMSIKATMQGDKLTIKYLTVCHLASERDLRSQISTVSDESVQLTNDYMKNLRNEFKSIVGRALKVKEESTQDSIEMLTTSPHTPRKAAYYRRFTTFTIE